MQLVGTFQAQYFKLISTDPNTIFQFVVIPDRIFLLKIGSSLNQIPQILTKNLVGGPIGLKEHKAENIPSIEQLRALVEKINNEKTLGFTSSSVRSREIPLEQIASAEIRKGLLGRGLHLKLSDGEKMFFRFLKPESESAAQKALASVLNVRYSVR